MKWVLKKLLAVYKTKQTVRFFVFLSERRQKISATRNNESIEQTDWDFVSKNRSIGKNALK